MYFLVVLIMTGFVIPRDHCIPLPENASTNDVLLLEVPSQQDAADKLDGDRLLLEGRNFSGFGEMVNNLEEGKKKVPNPETTPESYSIVVPVARNFSSLKELFAILSDDDAGPTEKVVADVDRSFVKGTENNSSDYMIFFTT